jgi:hypothetical protein
MHRVGAMVYVDISVFAQMEEHATAEHGVQVDLKSNWVDSSQQLMRSRKKGREMY